MSHLKIIFHIFFVTDDMKLLGDYGYAPLIYVTLPTLDLVQAGSTMRPIMV